MCLWLCILGRVCLLISVSCLVVYFGLVRRLLFTLIGLFCIAFCWAFCVVLCCCWLLIYLLLFVTFGFAIVVV